MFQHHSAACSEHCASRITRASVKVSPHVSRWTLDSAGDRDVEAKATVQQLNVKVTGAGGPGGGAAWGEKR